MARLIPLKLQGFTWEASAMSLRLRSATPCPVPSIPRLRERSRR